MLTALCFFHVNTDTVMFVMFSSVDVSQQEFRLCGVKIPFELLCEYDSPQISKARADDRAERAKRINFQTGGIRQGKLNG